jgi:hypothetical protein
MTQKLRGSDKKAAKIEDQGPTPWRRPQTNTPPRRATTEYPMLGRTQRDFVVLGASVISGDSIGMLAPCQKSLQKCYISLRQTS